MFFYNYLNNFVDLNYMLSPYTIYVPLGNEIQQNDNQIAFCGLQIKINQKEEDLVSVMTKALVRKHEKSKSKLWTQEEDGLLIQLVQKQMNWQKIAQRFLEKSQVVCIRRYKRLIKQRKKWPKEKQKLIKNMYQVEKLSWAQIQTYLPEYTKKQIKQRYKNFLEVDTKRMKWTVEQDLKLWQLIREYGNNWVQFTKILNGRSQLQLKNRYNKFIKPIEQRLFEHKQILNSQCSQVQFEQ